MAWLSDVYLVCAIVGGTLLVLQTVLAAVGGHGGDHDFSHDVDHDVGPGPDPGAHSVGHEGQEGAFIKWLSLRTIVAFLTFFGLAGLACQRAGFVPAASILVATAVGSAAVFAIAFLMASLAQLQSRGNLDLANAVGRPAKVYLRIPGGKRGHGKVTLEVQGRFVEVEAVTAGPDVPTGADVRVVGLLSPETLEVVPLESELGARP